MTWGNPKVKCPGCGSISFPGVQQCKKCGHRFAPAPPDATASLPAQSAESAALEEIPVVPEFPATPEIVGLDPAAKGTPEEPLDAIPPESEKRQPAPKPSPASAEKPQQTWRSELAARVDDFRQRRARVRRKSDPNSILKLDLDEVPIIRQKSISAELMEVPRVSGIFDPAPIKVDTRRERVPVLDSEAQKAPEEWLRLLGERVEGEPPVAGSSPQTPAPDLRPGPPAAIESGPLEIPLGAPQTLSDAGTAELVSHKLTLAPRAGRAIAGVLDACVLLVAYGMFAVAFWWTGATASLRPVFLGVGASVFALVLFAYFAVNIAWGYTTPGLLAQGLEVRRMDAGRPSVADAVVRAFGVLVSLAAFGLGFIWCLVDSETLTWHDRMSRTVIVVKKVEAPANED